MREPNSIRDRTSTEFDAVLRRAKVVGKEIEAFATSRLSSLAVPEFDPLRAFQVSQALRGLSFFRGFLVLTELRLIGPAGALLRCLLEQHFVANAIALDPSLMQNLLETHKFHRRRNLKGLVTLPPETTDFTADLANLLSEVDSEARETSVRTWAKKAGCEELYVTTYAYLCKYVHASLKACDEHLLLDGEQFLGVTTEVNDDMLPCFLATASRIMLFLTWESFGNCKPQDDFFDRATHECDDIMETANRWEASVR